MDKIKSYQTRLACASFALGLTLCCIGTAERARISRNVAFSTIPVDGSAIELPTGREDRIQLVLSGTFLCEYDGKRYDARYVFSESGAPIAAHSLVELSPRLRLVRGDPVRHEYEYELAHEWHGKHLRIRLNTHRLVDQFLITPSEVIASLRGGLRYTVWFRSPASHALPAGLVLLAIAVVCLHRLRGLDADLRACLAEIQVHSRGTLRGLPKDIRRLSRIPRRLRQVCLSSRFLARQIQDLRNTITRMEPRRLRAIEELERTSAHYPQAGSDLEKTHAAKRSLLDTLDQMRQSHARLLGRLQSVAAAVADYHLQVARMAQLESESDVDAVALEEVSAELGALDATLRQIKGMERKGSIWC